METSSTGLPAWGRRFLFIAAVVVTAIFVALGCYTVSAVKQQRAEAKERHQARLDPKAAEAGRTAADTELPAGAAPRRVKVGIYLDGIASISLLDSEWSPVF